MRARVRLLTRDKGEVLIEASSFVVMKDARKGVTLESVGKTGHVEPARDVRPAS